MPEERVASSQTIVHHDSWTEPEAGQTAEPEVHNEETSDAGETPQSGDGNEYDAEHTARERQIDRIEAQIQAAARAAVATFEDVSYHGEDSVISSQSYETYDEQSSELGYNPDNTRLTYPGSEGEYETEDDGEQRQEGEEAGDSSSHHDGDIEDDVFSNSQRSSRSSMNSCHLTGDEANQKELTSPVVGEEAPGTISRIPSAASYTPMRTPHTPSKSNSRPAFRNPSSVRAMQMSSPPASVFSSPRSNKRHLPAISRAGTPTSHSSFSPSKRTPTRFKAKKEPPLVLLHVTVLPLNWAHARAISSPDLPSSLHGVKENYRLLHEKLGDTVLERGVLLPHPQDSYEVLEERLLEALELPVRPRARILKCGHYMGPETPASDDEGRVRYVRVDDRKWCDICERDVKIEGSGMDGSSETKFRVKIYASNGLMRAGAWAAAWREMERVDVELEPFVEDHLAGELDDFAAGVTHLPEVAQEYEDDGFVDEDEVVEHAEEVADHHEEEQRRAHEEDMMRRQMMEEERLREVYGHGHPRAESRASVHHQPAPRPTPRRVEHGDSLPELLLAAFKVAMRDRKNVLICLLSVLVLLLAIRPGMSPQPLDPVVRGASWDNIDVLSESIATLPPTTEIPQVSTIVPESKPAAALDDVLKVGNPEPRVREEEVLVEVVKDISLEEEKEIPLKEEEEVPLEKNEELSPEIEEERSLEMESETTSDLEPSHDVPSEGASVKQLIQDDSTFESPNDLPEDELLDAPLTSDSSHTEL